MAIANLANIPGDWRTLQQWTFSHMDHHRQINRAILAKFKKQLPLYPLDPLNALNMGVFLYQHQDLHSRQNLILGIQSLNLLGVDWNDETQRATWIFQNFTEHFQASSDLGIG